MTDQVAVELENIVSVAIHALEDLKAQDILVLDTHQKTSMFSRMIVASGSSTRQVKALANNVSVAIKEAGFDVLSSEGLDSGEWALVDLGDAVVHVMLPVVRDYYDIEALWGGEKPSFHHDDGHGWHILEK